MWMYCFEKKWSCWEKYSMSKKEYLRHISSCFPYWMKLGIEGVMSDYCTKIEKLIFKEYSSGIDDVLPSVEVNVGGKK